MCAFSIHNFSSDTLQHADHATVVCFLRVLQQAATGFSLTIYEFYSSTFM